MGFLESADLPLDPAPRDLVICTWEEITGAWCEGAELGHEEIGRMAQEGQPGLCQLQKGKTLEREIFWSVSNVWALS